MKALILEDTISYVWDYEMILQKLGVDVVGVHKTWKDLVTDIRKASPDFMIIDLFLDQNEKGLDFIREVQNWHIPMIVCTGYPEQDFMDEALEYGVHAFFSKPLDKAALTYEIKKLMISIQEADNSRYLLTKDKGVLIKVPFNKIYKIEIDGNYSSIYTLSGKKFVVKLSLKKLFEKLDEKIFVRCHRSTIVNINFLKKMDVPNNKIGLTNDEVIDLGNTFKNEMKAIFKNG